MKRSGNWTPEAIAIVLLAALVAICYLPGLPGPFLLDDLANISLSKVDSLSWSDWVLAITSNHSGRFGRPIAAASFAVTNYFFEFHPLPFKIGNIALHLATGLLLWMLGSRIVENLPSPLSVRHSLLASALAATLWLLHPLHVSTTLYAVQRMTQLSTIFVILALSAYVTLRPRFSHRPIATLAQLAATVAVTGGLGLLSKENAALLPVYLLLLETLVFHWRSDNTQAKRALWMFQGVFVLAPITLGAAYVITHFGPLTASYANRPFDLTERLLTEAHALWFYIRQILVPDIGTMSLFHDGFPIQRSLDWITALALAGHAALGLSALWLWRRAPIYSLGIGLFYSTHLLESTFIPLEPVFEHRNYFAAWGLLLIVGYMSVRALEKATSRLSRVRIVALVLVLVSLLSYSTQERAGTWGELPQIYAHAIDLEHPSPRAAVGQANLFFRLGEFGHGRALLNKAIDWSPPNAIGPVMDLLLTYCGTGAMPAGLYQDAHDRLRRGTNNAYARNTLLTFVKFHSTGRCPEVSKQELISLTRQFLLNPGSATGTGRYHALMNFARALSTAGRYTETILVLRSADAMRHSVPNAAKSLALHGITLQYLRMGDSSRARVALLEFTRLTSDPRIPARPHMRPYVAQLRDMSVAERYGLIDLDKHSG